MDEALEIFADGLSTALWLDGGLFVSDGFASVLLDAPDGVGRRLRAVPSESASFDGPDAVLFTSGRPAACAGFPGLIAAAIAAGRTRPLRVWSVLGDEAIARLVDAAAAWEPPFDLVVESEPPGVTVTVGALEIAAVALRRGQDTSPLVGFRASIGADGYAIAYVPGVGPGVKALVHGVRVAVIETGQAGFSPGEAQEAALRHGALAVVAVRADGTIVPSVAD